MLAGLAPGSLVAGYRLDEQIGTGGTGVVFRARDEAQSRTIALKALVPASGDEQLRWRFLRESRAAATIKHPNILPVYAAGQADDVTYLAMRFVAGGDLRDVRTREGRLSGQRIIALLAPVASALDIVHAGGLVHRNIKPSNILVDIRPGHPDHPYLSDFGLVQDAAAPAPSGPGQFRVTPEYLAPEQVSGAPARPQTDQYSLACVAYTLLADTPPFLGDDPAAVLRAHRYDAPPSLVARRPDAPAAVDGVFARAMAKSPDDRYGSCEEMIGSLRTAFGLVPQAAPDYPSFEGRTQTVFVPPAPAPAPIPGTAPVAAAPAFAPSASGAGPVPMAPISGGGGPVPVEQPPPPRRRRRGLIIAVAAVVLVLLAGGGTLLAIRPWVHPPVLRPTGLAVRSDAVTATGTTDDVEITWAGPATGPLPDSYLILRNGAQVGRILGTRTSYSEAGLTPNTTYDYQVLAVRGGKQSPASATVAAQTPPLQPGDLSVKGETTSSVVIGWSGPAAGPPPGGYEILRNGARVGTVAGTVTRYTDRNLAPDTRYHYQVVAVTGSEQSPASATLTSAQTTKPPLSAAVLDWNGLVTEKMISISPSESGWRLQPGKSTQDTWDISPSCSSGPCDATLSGAYDGYTYTAKLTRSGSGTSYSGTATLKNYYYCGSKSDTYSGTLTVHIALKSAATTGVTWTATTFAGSETVYTPAAYNCYAATGQLTVAGG